MTLDVEVAAPDDTWQTAAQIVADTGAGVLPSRVHRLPVLDQEKTLIGIVSLGERALASRDRERPARAVKGIVRPTDKHRQ